MELHQTRSPTAGSATAWGWIALGLTILSAVGYALQTILDYVTVPDDVVRLVFYGFFEWDGLLALAAGIIVSQPSCSFTRNCNAFIGSGSP